MQNARRAHKIRLCGHLRRYKKIVKKTYIIYMRMQMQQSSKLVPAQEQRPIRY